MNERTFKFQPAFWFYIAGTLALLLSLIAVLFSYELASWYWRTRFGPNLERDLGFKAAFETREGFQGRALVIHSVVEGGVFERAGIRAGDRPWDYHGREEITFFQALQAARGGNATLTLTLPGGTSGKGDMATMMRFKVAVPAESGGPTPGSS